METTTNRKKLYLLIPLDLLNKKHNEQNKLFYFNLISYLLITTLVLLHILNIINFVTYNYKNNITKTFHFVMIILSTIIFARSIY